MSNNSMSYSRLLEWRILKSLLEGSTSIVYKKQRAVNPSLAFRQVIKKRFLGI